MAEPVASVRALSNSLGNVIVVLKGENDIISDGKQGMVWDFTA